MTDDTTPTNASPDEPTPATSTAYPENDNATNAAIVGRPTPSPDQLVPQTTSATKFESSSSPSEDVEVGGEPSNDCNTPDERNDTTSQSGNAAMTAGRLDDVKDSFISTPSPFKKQVAALAGINDDHSTRSERTQSIVSSNNVGQEHMELPPLPPAPVIEPVCETITRPNRIIAIMTQGETITPQRHALGNIDPNVVTVSTTTKAKAYVDSAKSDVQNSDVSIALYHEESRRILESSNPFHPNNNQVARVSLPLDPFDPNYDEDLYDEYVKSRAHRAYGCSQETRHACEARNKLYLRWIRENEKLSHFRQYTELLDVPEPMDLPLQHALLRGRVVVVSAGHYGPCQYDINCRTFEVHHDTTNAGLVARGLDPLGWLQIADQYSDLFCVKLPYYIFVDGKKVPTHYKLFDDNLTTEERQEWNDAETLVLKSRIKDAADEGMEGMSVMAYGEEPRKVYSPRYLAALTQEAESRSGGKITSIHQSKAYDEYVGSWVELGLDNRPKIRKFYVRIYKCPHHGKLFMPGGASEDEKLQMQDAIIQWQGGLFQGQLLEGMNDNHILNNYTDADLRLQRARLNDIFVHFFGKWPREERESLLLSKIPLEFFRKHGFLVVYEYAKDLLPEIYDHARQCPYSDKSKRPASQTMVTVQHLLMFRVSRAVAASLLARSIDPSKQYRELASATAASLLARSIDPSKQYHGGGQFTPSATAAGRAASVLARSIDSSKQYRGGGQFTPSATAAGRAASVLARSIDSSKQYRGGGQFTPSAKAAGRAASALARKAWTSEELETFQHAVIVNGFCQITKIAASIEDKNYYQVQALGTYFQKHRPATSAELVKLHKEYVSNLYCDGVRECIETATTKLFLSKVCKKRPRNKNNYRVPECQVCGCSTAAWASKFYNEYRVCDRHYSVIYEKPSIGGFILTG